MGRCGSRHLDMRRNLGEEQGGCFVKYPRTIAGVTGAGIAAATLLIGGAPAQAQVFDYANNTNSRTVSWNGTQVYVYAKVDRSHKASYAYVSSGGGHVQARAQCQRASGGKKWYQSTIRVGAGGGSSHYDCDNNGTYNRAVVGLGVDIN